MPRDLSDEILIAFTTFRGSRERSLILRKVLRHFRVKNHRPYRVLLLSDGPLAMKAVQEYADYAFSMRQTPGMYHGEYWSIRFALDFALAQGYPYLLKLGGDIICNTDEWVQHFYDLMRGQRKYFLSTHWFADDSHIFGTKFFLAHAEMLRRAFPDSVVTTDFERQITAALCRAYDLPSVAYLINSMTGERHENRHELRAADWQHAHRLYKFKGLDAGLSPLRQIVNTCVVYPGFRLVSNLRHLNSWRRR
jgi:hypothetical protein